MNRNIPIDRVADILAPGESVYVPGGIAVPLAFLTVLQNRPERSRDLRILTSIAPGIDTPFDVECLHPAPSSADYLCSRHCATRSAKVAIACCP